MRHFMGIPEFTCPPSPPPSSLFRADYGGGAAEGVLFISVFEGAFYLYCNLTEIY